jgi:hypothetical protein
MKFKLETIIAKPRAEVWKAFDNPDNLSKWQDGLKSFEHVSGEAGKPGAVSKLTFIENGREIVLMETVTRRIEPEAMDGTYVAPGVKNHIRNTFVEISPVETKWLMETEFIFNSIPMRAFGAMMKGAFLKRTSDNLQKFKAFVERN